MRPHARTLDGLLWCGLFVTLDAGQAVYFGRFLQFQDSFLVGGLVFGLSAALALLHASGRRRAELALAVARPWLLLGLNLSTAGAWALYLLALQRIEPAICFAIFSGLVPLTTIAAHRLGVSVASGMTHPIERAGNALIAVGLFFAAVATLVGLSGFADPGPGGAALGLLLATLAGVLVSIMLLCGRSLDRDGVGPAVQYGLRFPLYVILCLLGWWTGLDAKASVDPFALSLTVAAGMVLLAFPIYAVQRAIPLVDAMTIATVAAVTPALIVFVQLVDPRVEFSWTSLASISIFCAGALLAAAGRSLGSRVTLSYRRR